VIGFITERTVVKAILEHLGLPTTRRACFACGKEGS
jgi:hypothetical protein